MHRPIKNFSPSPPRRDKSSLPPSPPRIDEFALVHVARPRWAQQQQQPAVPFEEKKKEEELSPPKDRQKQQQLAPLTARTPNSPSARSPPLAVQAPTCARLMATSGFDPRAVVLEIQRGGTEQSLVHSTGGGGKRRGLPPLALELTSFIRREISRAVRRDEGANSSSGNNLEVKLSIVRESLSCLQAHFAPYDECFNLLVGILNSAVGDCTELEKQRAEMELLRRSADSLVEAQLQEARDQQAQRIAADVVEKRRLKQEIAALEQEVAVQRGNFNYQKRQNIHLQSELSGMTKRCNLFQTSLSDETSRAIKLGQRLNKLTGQNVALRDNLQFLDKLLQDAQDEVEKLTGGHGPHTVTKKEDNRKKKRRRRHTQEKVDDSDSVMNLRILARGTRQRVKSLLANSGDADDGGEEDEQQQQQHVSDTGSSLSDVTDEDSEYDSDVDDSSDPDIPISTRKDRALVRGIRHQRKGLLSLDTQMHRLCRLNGELQQKLAAAQRQISAQAEELTARREDLTPRPTWLRVREFVPSFILDVEASSEEILEDVILSARAELAAASGRSARGHDQSRHQQMSHAMQEWLREENLSESDVGQMVRMNSKFIARGSGSHVPVFLRTPPGCSTIPNKRLSKFTVESILKKFWSARRSDRGIATAEEVFLVYRISNRRERKQKLQQLQERRRSSSSSSSSRKILPIDFFFAEFCETLTQSRPNAIILAYNIADVCMANMGDPDCLGFSRSVLSPEISEFAVFDAEDVVSIVRGTLDVAAQSSGSGFLSKPTLQRILLGLFTTKDSESHLRLRAQLSLSVAAANKKRGNEINNSNNNNIVDLRALFAEDEACNESSFVVELRLQALEAYCIYALEVENALRIAGSRENNSDYLSLGAARAAFLELDPGLMEHDDVLLERLSAGTNLPPTASILRDHTAKFPLEPFLDRIRRGVLLKRYSTAPPSNRLHEQAETAAVDRHEQRIDFSDFLSQSASAAFGGGEQGSHPKPLSLEDGGGSGFFDFMEKIIEEEERDHSVSGGGGGGGGEQQHDDDDDGDGDSETLVQYPEAEKTVTDQSRIDNSDSSKQSPVSKPPIDGGIPITSQRAALLRQSFRRREKESSAKKQKHKKKHGGGAAGHESQALRKLELEIAKERREERERRAHENEEDRRMEAAEAAAAEAKKSIAGRRKSVRRGSWTRPLMTSQQQQQQLENGEGHTLVVSPSVADAQLASHEENMRRTHTMLLKQQQEARRQVHSSTTATLPMRRKSTVAFNNDDGDH